MGIPQKNAQSNLNPKLFLESFFSGTFFVLKWKLGGDLELEHVFLVAVYVCVFLLVGLFLGMLLGRCCCGGGDGGGDPPPPSPPAAGSCAPP